MKAQVTWDGNDDGEKRWRVIRGEAIFKVTGLESAAPYDVSATASDAAMTPERRGDRSFAVKFPPRPRLTAAVVTFSVRARPQAGVAGEPGSASREITLVDGRAQPLAVLASGLLIALGAAGFWMGAHVSAGKAWVEAVKWVATTAFGVAVIGEVRSWVTQSKTPPFGGVLHIPSRAFLALGLALLAAFTVPRRVLTAVENLTAGPIRGAAAELATLAPDEMLMFLGRPEEARAKLAEAPALAADYSYSGAAGDAAPTIGRWLGIENVAVRCAGNEWTAAARLTPDGGAPRIQTARDCQRKNTPVSVDPRLLTAAVDRAPPRPGGDAKGGTAVVVAPDANHLADESWFGEHFAKNLRVRFHDVLGAPHQGRFPADVVLASTEEPEFPRVTFRYDDATGVEPLVAPVANVGGVTFDVMSPNAEQSLGKLECHFLPSTRLLDVWQLPATGVRSLKLDGKGDYWYSSWTASAKGSAWACRPDLAAGDAAVVSLAATFARELREPSAWSLEILASLAPAKLALKADDADGSLACSHAPSSPSDEVALDVQPVQFLGHWPGQHLEFELAFGGTRWTSSSPVTNGLAWRCSPAGYDAGGAPLSTPAGEIDPASNILTVKTATPKECDVYEDDDTARLPRGTCKRESHEYVVNHATKLSDCNKVFICDRR